MYDRGYLESSIRRLQEEKSQHDRKFAGNPVHEDCLPRFDQAIEKLRQELEKLTGSADTTDDGA